MHFHVSLGHCGFSPQCPEAPKRSRHIEICEYIFQWSIHELRYGIPPTVANPNRGNYHYLSFPAFPNWKPNTWQIPPYLSLPPLFFKGEKGGIQYQVLSLFVRGEKAKNTNPPPSKKNTTRCRGRATFPKKEINGLQLWKSLVFQKWFHFSTVATCERQKQNSGPKSHIFKILKLANKNNLFYALH